MQILVNLSQHEKKYVRFFFIGSVEAAMFTLFLRAPSIALLQYIYTYSTYEFRSFHFRISVKKSPNLYIPHDSPWCQFGSNIDTIKIPFWYRYIIGTLYTSYRSLRYHKGHTAGGMRIHRNFLDGNAPNFKRKKF